MLRKSAYILIGDNDTGKTTFQKYLIWFLCGIDKFNKLNTNLVHPINHRDAPRKLETLFTMNRSIQEKMGDYKNVDNYFHSFFRDADICILSSHSHSPCIDEIREMIIQLNRKYYNVSSVFFSNHLNPATEEISTLNWEERIIINNPSAEDWETQIKNGAEYFSQMIIRKSHQY